MKLLLPIIAVIGISFTSNTTLYTQSKHLRNEIQFFEAPDSSNKLESVNETTWDSSWDDDWYDGSSIDTSITPESAFHSLKYEEAIQLIKTKKEQIHLDTLNPKAKLKTAEKLLLNSLTKDIFPYWYGTKWDFNGITKTPGKGEIACGYFVSTTLKQIGFNLNRYRIAQKAASEVINTFCLDSLIFKTTELDHLLAQVKEGKDGVYILGLSYHVGFIHKERDHIYFIHSNFSMPSMVIREHATKSAALHTSDVFVLGKLSENENLLSNWLTNTVIQH